MAGVEAASVELEHNLWIVVDRTTEEALVRTFIRDDGLMNSWSMGPAMAKAHAKVASKALRGVIVHELRALQADEPDHKSWSHHLVQATLTKATMTADEAMSLLPRWTGEIQDSH